MLFDPSNGECGYIDASRCRPGQTIHIPDIFKTFGKLKEEKPKVFIFYFSIFLCGNFTFRLFAMLLIGLFIAKAKENSYLNI